MRFNALVVLFVAAVCEAQGCGPNRLVSVGGMCSKSPTSDIGLCTYSPAKCAAGTRVENQIKSEPRAGYCTSNSQCSLQVWRLSSCTQFTSLYIN